MELATQGKDLPVFDITELQAIERLNVPTHLGFKITLDEYLLGNHKHPG